MIYTFGDGYAANHIWPEWPQFVELLTNVPVKNFGHIGAGNEFIFNCAVKSSLTANESDIFLIQWSLPNRFDKILENEEWKLLQETDTVYKNIIANVFEQTWWSTSNSQLKEILNYNDFYVQKTQAINQSLLYMISLSNMLSNLKIKHYYFSTPTINWNNNYLFKFVNKLPWIEKMGMEEWSSNLEFRGNQIQPSPVIHFKWVVEKILPALKINIEKDIIDKIYKILIDNQFEPYYFDREQKWKNLKNEISLLFK